MSSQIKSPLTMADDSSLGDVAWVNPDNSKVSDNVYSVVTLTSAHHHSHWLKATNFGFNIPPGSTILGIKISCEAKASVTGWILDYVRVIKGGVIGTTSQDLRTYTLVDSYKSYGVTETYLWGESWTYEDINDPTFGFAIATFGGIPTYVVSIDHIEVTVFYTEPVGINVIIDGVVRSNIIEFGSIQKIDAINQQTDTLNFNIISGQGFYPETNSEVILMDDATKIFGGKIYSVSKEREGNGSIKCSVKCKDYSYDLARLLVVETYESMTVTEVIQAVIDDYTTGFTYVNVNCDLDVVKVTFDRVSVVEVLNRLANMSGYSWYVDYDKDIHFFEKSTEPAPFNLTDGDGNHITDSLKISDDFSQIRNRVFIKGGEIEGDARTETFNGDGSKKQFKLANKFAKLPTVSVGGVVKTVGVDFLDNEDDYDCFWDYNQSYIRFKDSTIPGSGTNNISVTGIPLYNLVVQVEEPASIAEFGVFEFAKTDKTIKSRATAVAMAKSEIEAYKNGLIEGSFETYTSGLRSGQIITINSTSLDVNESFLIQRVGFKMITTTQYYWQVTLATLRTVGIIDFLIGLLKNGDHVIEDTGESVLEKTVFPVEQFTIGDAVEVNTDNLPQTETLSIDETVYRQAIDFATVFVAGPYIPDPSDPSDVKRVFCLDGSRLS